MPPKTRGTHNSAEREMISSSNRVKSNNRWNNWNVQGARNGPSDSDFGGRAKTRTRMRAESRMCPGVNYPRKRSPPFERTPINSGISGVSVRTDEPKNDLWRCPVSHGKQWHLFRGPSGKGGKDACG
ncbi:F-box/LRR-repeat protein 4 [Anopheles sinensis]|uniref:F-box/LRR-repeat protein 4 n=1 Tax=Anopheles sinensis TaxID=74873 RepID=A0A084WLX5_ANOSI|nr:F-box/LRR-repeat protein 4 [Anopheles sinensis]